MLHASSRIPITKVEYYCFQKFYIDIIMFRSQLYTVNRNFFSKGNFNRNVKNFRPNKKQRRR